MNNNDTIALFILVGVFIGWVVRSIVFAHDRDCANPDHQQKGNDHERETYHPD